MLQKNDAQFPLTEDGLLTFLADDIRKNVAPSDGEHGPPQLLNARLKPFEQQVAAQQAAQQPEPEPEPEPKPEPEPEPQRWRSMQYSLPRCELAVLLPRLGAVTAAAQTTGAAPLPIELKFVARRAGSTLLGANSEVDIVAVNVHWPAHAHELLGLERLLQERGGVPHLGKLHTLPDGYAASVLPGLADFERVAAELDPRGMFRFPPGGSSLPSQLSIPHQP